MKASRFVQGCVAVVVMMLAVSAADAYIIIRWNSGPQPFIEFGTTATASEYLADPSMGVDSGSLVQLIWSSDDSYADMPLIGDADPSFNDYVIDAHVVSAAQGLYEGYIEDRGGVEYDYTSVPGLTDDGTFEAGYVYARVFDAETPTVGAHYWQSPHLGGLQTDPNRDQPNSWDRLVWPTDGSNPTPLDMTIVPEPGTLALFGLGLATIAMRRRLRK